MPCQNCQNPKLRGASESESVFRKSCDQVINKWIDIHR